MKKFGALHLLGVLVECCAVVFLILCIASDINDDLFLPLALGCTAVGCGIGLVIQRKAQKSQERAISAICRRQRCIRRCYL